MSAFEDFLESSLADDLTVVQNTNKQIELEYLSLWRALLVMTTIGQGDARLTYDPKREQKLDIDFGWKIDPSRARTKLNLFCSRRM